MAPSLPSHVLGGRVGRQARARADAYFASREQTPAAKQLAEAIAKQPRRHKFGVSEASERRHPRTNELFHSKAELKRCLELELMQRAGEIADLQRQVQFSLTVPAHRAPTGNWVLPLYVGCYIADFVYLKDGKQIVEDVKGFDTPEYRLKKRLVKALHDVDIVEVRT